MSEANLQPMPTNMNASGCGVSNLSKSSFVQINVTLRTFNKTGVMNGELLVVYVRFCIPDIGRQQQRRQCQTVLEFAFFGCKGCFYWGCR